MSGSTNAIVDEEIIKSIFYKFVEGDLEQKTMSGGTNATVDEELLKSILCTSRRVVKDAFEQKTVSIQSAKALSDYFLDLLERDDPLARQIMGIACDQYLKETEYLKETVSPL